MQRYLWSKPYGEAIRENERTVRMGRINLAVNELLRSLIEIGADSRRSAEQRELLCALNDLRIMIHLHRKYAQFALIQPPVPSPART